MRLCERVLKNFLKVEVKTFRKKRAVTQEVLAERLEISTRSYADLEHGKKGFSANSLMNFMLLMTPEEAGDFLERFRKEKAKGDDRDGMS